MSEQPTSTLCLIRAAQQGDRQAENDLFARYLPRVQRIVSLRMGRRLASLAEYEDLAQETLLRIFRGLQDFEQKSEGSFRNWLALCVERAVADAARRLQAKKRGSGEVRQFGQRDQTISLSQIFSGDDPTPSAVCARKETEERIEELLLALPEHHRELVILRHFCELSYEEIAETMGVASESTVRKGLQRVLEKLKQQLDPDMV